jgi:hydrogenase 3 maturation protease
MKWVVDWKVLEQELKRFTKDYKKIIILCIGNDMRGDDAIGPNVAGNLKEVFKNQDDIMVINATTVPENYTGLIRSETPSHIIFIDAVEMNKAPGHIKLVKSDEIANYSISTHAMPLSFMIRYLESFTDAKKLLIGVQPKNIEMYHTISKEVKDSIVELSKMIQNSLKN